MLDSKLLPLQQRSDQSPNRCRGSRNVAGAAPTCYRHGQPSWHSVGIVSFQPVLDKKPLQVQQLSGQSPDHSLPLRAGRPPFRQPSLADCFSRAPSGRWSWDGSRWALARFGCRRLGWPEEQVFGEEGPYLTIPGVRRRCQADGESKFGSKNASSASGANTSTWKPGRNVRPAPTDGPADGAGATDAKKKGKALAREELGHGPLLHVEAGPSSESGGEGASAGRSRTGPKAAAMLILGGGGCMRGSICF